MRIAVLSDIHGNLLALDAVLADLAEREPVDHTVVAGDLVWAGPCPAQVVDRVCSLGAAVIQGNTDAFFVRYPEDAPVGKGAERFAAQLAWMREQLGRKRVAFLTDLPFAQRFSPAPGHDLLIVHANPTDLDRGIYPNLPEAEVDALLIGDGCEPDWEALAFGHIHIPFVRRWRGRLLVDVASVGLPMDGDARACYAILAWDGAAWHAEHHRVSYAAPLAADQMRTGGMPRGKHFAERLLQARYAPVA